MGEGSLVCQTVNLSVKLERWKLPIEADCISTKADCEVSNQRDPEWKYGFARRRRMDGKGRVGSRVNNGTFPKIHTSIESWKINLHARAHRTNIMGNVREDRVEQTPPGVALIAGF